MNKNLSVVFKRTTFMFLAVAVLYACNQQAEKMDMRSTNKGGAIPGCEADDSCDALPTIAAATPTPGDKVAFKCPVLKNKLNLNANLVGTLSGNQTYPSVCCNVSERALLPESCLSLTRPQ